MSPLESLRSRLTDIQPSGQGFKARCPAHDDRKSSLSVREGDDGRALIKCFAGCETRDILEALGMTWADLFDSGQDGDASERRDRRIVTTYDYRDDVGTLLYQVVRYEPKDFRQRRPDGAGGWLWNLDGVQRVLYRLPDLGAADQAVPVFLVEGEKDADNLVAAGLVATTNAGGAAKWQDDFAEALRGRTVIVLPDNDDAGRRHADQMTRSLHEVAEEVKILDLPGLPPKGDVSDWLTAGGTSEELRRLAAEAPAWSPGAEPSGTRSSGTTAQDRTWPPPLQDPAYHGLVGDVVRTLDPHTEADPAAILTNLLVMVGSAAGGGPTCGSVRLATGSTSTSSTSARLQRGARGPRTQDHVCSWARRTGRGIPAW